MLSVVLRSDLLQHYPLTEMDLCVQVSLGSQCLLGFVCASPPLRRPPRRPTPSHSPAIRLHHLAMTTHIAVPSRRFDARAPGVRLGPCRHVAARTCIMIPRRRIEQCNVPARIRPAGSLSPT